MPEPTTRRDLVARIRSDRGALKHSVHSLSDSQLSAPGAAGHWSAKDILVHVSWWERRTIEKLHGLPTAHDQLGGPDNDQLIATLNEHTHSENRDRPAADVLAACETALDDLVTALEQAEEQFVLAHLEFIAENTYRHYPEHTRHIEQWVTQIR